MANAPSFVLLLSVIGLGVSALADEVQPLNEPSVDEALDEIVVTATRRETPLQETALSVAVLTGDYLDEAGLRDFDDYWRQVPSMSVTDSGPFGTLAVIRGLSANFGAPSDEPLSSLYFDETPLTNPSGFFTAPPDLYLVDMERVEVLRGPQGTLFGASSMGGAIRYISNKPNLSASQFSVESGFSTTDHGGNNTELNAVVNQVLVPDSSAARLVAYYRDDAGFIDDIGLNRSDINWRETTGMRLSATSLINERLSITGKVIYQDIEAGAYNEIDPNGKPEIGLPIEQDYQLALLVPESRSDEVVLYNLEAKYSAELADWLFITSYFEHETDYVIDIADEMNFAFGQYLPAPIDGTFSQDTFVQELRVVSNSGGEFGWLAGAFFLDEEGPYEELISAPGFNNNPFCTGVNPPPPPGAPFPTCTGTPDGEEVLQDGRGLRERTELGVYGNISYDIGERWQLVVGGRWYDVSTSILEQGGGFFAGGFDLPDSYDDLADERGSTWMGSLAFRPTRNALLYARAAQGFRPGGANGEGFLAICTAATDRYESDSLWSYELGARLSGYDGRLVFNATTYLIDWDDAQISIFDIDCGSYYTANSGEASSRGFEIEMAASVSEWWALRLGVGTTNAELDRAINDPSMDAPKGTTLPYVPDVTASLVSDFIFPVGNGWQGFSSIDVQHTGRSYSNLDLATRVVLPAYTLIGLRAGIDFGEWRTELYADNVFDEQAMYACCRLNGEYVTNRPRTIGLRVSYGG